MLLDVVCQRYPGRRPSDYLDIEDEYTALQLDFAVAYKHRKNDIDAENSKTDALIAAIKTVGSALGVKYVSTAQTSKVLPDDLYVDEILPMIGGKNTMVDLHGKK